MITLCETLTSLVEKKVLNEDEKILFINIIKSLKTFNYPNFKFYMNKCF